MDSIVLQLIRLPEVCRLTGSSRSVVYMLIKAGLFPQPVKRGRTAAWPAHEVKAVIAARIAGRTDEHLLRLVDRLHRERQLLEHLSEGGGLRDAA